MDLYARFWIGAVRRALNDPLQSARLLTTGVGWRRIRFALRPGPRRELTHSPEGLEVRGYSSYRDYLDHQRGKLSLLDLTEYDRKFRQTLAARLSADQVWAGRVVLCLAARLGSEVRAFHDAGAFAVGIDLNPGEQNEYVLHGDFHQLVFPDASVDVVYTNSLDHALDLKRLVHEVSRVLRPGGTFLVDARVGASETEFDQWAATSWQEMDDLVAAIEQVGLTLVRRRDIEVPWRGEELLFSNDQVRRPVVDSQRQTSAG